ncbi:MAG: adenylate/guanylate cyclase domain-containing protein [Oscillatoriaceae cyanobacterium]
MWKKFKKTMWEWRGVWVVTPSIAGLVILLRFAGLLQAWEWGSYDLFFHLRPLEPPDNRVAIVGINEDDVHEIGQSIIPDAIYAELLSKLAAMEARAIGLDVYKDLPVEPGAKELETVFANTPQIIGIQKVVGEAGRDTVAANPTLKAKGQVGANDMLADADQRVRRGLVMVADNDNNILPSFSLATSILYLQGEGINYRFGDREDNKGKLYFNDTELVRFEPNDGGYIRADRGGYQILLNYRGPSQHFETVSMMDIIKGRVPPDWAKDRVILIGKVGESFKDTFFTPYSSSLRSFSKPMAGVEVHANLVSQILGAVLDDRPLIKSWSEPVEWLWILFWSAAGAILTWKWRYANHGKYALLQKLGAPIIGGGIIVGSAYIAFLGGWWIPVVPPILALAGSVTTITAYIARTAGDIRKTFGRYLTDEVVANLLENPEGAKLGGERRSITILTSDLRGFTATSERLPPEEVIKVVNHYLEYMADAITTYNGTIDEFMGDGILVLFGAPTKRPDDAERAVACAVAMQLAMAPVNKQMEEWGLPPLEMGIGINTGEVVVGNIGSEKRTKYGIVGSQVNLTYRIEGYTTGGQILISESTLKEAGSIVKIDAEKQVQPKGVKEPITIYDVGGVTGKYNLFLKKEEEVFAPVPEAILLKYALLDGKHVGDADLKANIIQLSARGAELAAIDNGEGEFMPPPLTNIKLNLLIPNDGAISGEDVYAKVMEKEAAPGKFYIRFTAKPPVVSKMLDELYKSISH